MKREEVGECLDEKEEVGECLDEAGGGWRMSRRRGRRLENV